MPISMPTLRHCYCILLYVCFSLDSKQAMSTVVGLMSNYFVGGSSRVIVRKGISNPNPWFPDHWGWAINECYMLTDVQPGQLEHFTMFEAGHCAKKWTVICLPSRCVHDKCWSQFSRPWCRIIINMHCQKLFNDYWNMSNSMLWSQTALYILRKPVLDVWRGNISSQCGKLPET